MERAPLGNALFFVRCAQWPHLVGIKWRHQQQARSDVVAGNFQTFECNERL